MGAFMNLEQCDRYCDQFEARLQRGERITAEEFVRECRLPPDRQLLAELRRLEREYLTASFGAEDPHATAMASTDHHAEMASAEKGDEDDANKVIGNYKLLQKIGEGGMGMVYMAEQTQPVSRRVALKIVKPGMDSREIMARFEAERQALAMMDHPNIARVLDAGTYEKSRPYFVMELVRGVTITKYCDDRQLSLRQRLELFVPVCHAVQHAHQKGIIHRDLKPSNVLVAQYDTRPAPKVIDFGLAKAIGHKLTEKTMYTRFGQIVGTVDYMSPEQASFNQLDVDTRSDIYSLGVLLYELLVGETPFDKKRMHTAAFDELLRIIRLEEPPRPSARLSSSGMRPEIAAKRKSEAKSLSLALRGELDWVVMRAIEKDRDRRYQSASALAEDIQNYLTGEPVSACPPSAQHRFQKFARRNRVALTATAMVFAALLAGLAGTSVALVEARAANERTQVELRAKEGFINRLLVQFRVEQFQRKQYFAFERAISDLVKSFATQYGTSDEMVASGDRTTRDALLKQMIAFWDQMIQTDRDLTGKTGWRTEYYRLQRTMCVARLGDHTTAFDQAQSLEKELSQEGPYLPDLIRLYAICAGKTARETGLAELYLKTAMSHLRTAAEQAEAPPLPADDPDLAPLRSAPEFANLLETWRVNHDAKEPPPTHESLVNEHAPIGR